MITNIIRSLSENYPFNISELRRHQYILNWMYISRNTQIKWSEEIIDEFIDKLSWVDLSQNPSIPINKNFFKKFEDRWQWQYLTDNPLIPWSSELLEEYANKWAWEKIEFCGNLGLSLNRYLPWSIELIEKFKDRWFWGELSCNPSLPWSKELILKYKDKWIWGGHYGYCGLSINPSPIVKQLLLEYFPDKIEYEYFDLNDIYDPNWDLRELSQLDKLVLEYTKEYGLEKLICCINITTLGENNDLSAH